MAEGRFRIRAQAFGHQVPYYTLAILLTLLGVAGTALLHSFHSEAHFYFYPLMLAVLAASLWGGLGPGLLALGLSFLAYQTLLFSPIGDEHLNHQRAVSTILFLVVGLALTVVGASARRARARSEENLARLDALLDSSPMGHTFYDQELRYLRVNPALAATIGKSVSAFEGRTVREMLPNIAEAVEPLLRQVYETGVPVVGHHLSAQIPPDSGRWFHWLATYYPVVLPRGGRIGVGGTIVDVSEQTRVGEERRKALAQFNAVLQHIPHGVFALDAEGRVLFFNKRAEEILGRAPVPPAQAENELKSQLIGPDGSPLPAAEHPLMRAIVTGKAAGPEKVRFRHPDGSVHVLEWSTTPIYGNGAGVSGAVAIFADVTTRVEAEERARFLIDATAILHSSFDYADAVRRFAHKVVPFIADWCFIDLFDENGRTIRLAITHSDPEREAWAWDNYHRNGSEIYVSEAGTELIKQGKPFLVPTVDEATLRRFSANEAHYQMLVDYGLRSAVLLPLAVRGRAIGTFGLMTSESGRQFREDDLDFLKELSRRVALAVDNARLFQQAQDAVRVRDEFLSVASHDLRTPLTSVKLTVQRLARKAAQEGDASAPLHGDLDGLDRQVNRVISMFNVLMDVSRIHSGKLDLDLSETDLETVVHDVVQRMEPVFAAAGCQTEVQSRGPAVGYWDRVRIEQVVANLLTNAAKYGGGKPVQISIDSTDTSALLQVHDRGIGIAPEHQHRLFQRFERVGDKKAFAGTGLGLWITRQIVEAHGGSIQVDSNPVEGTTFTVLLPSVGVERRGLVSVH